MTEDRASDIALSGLQYIAGDQQELSRFVALTGVAPDEIRQIAGTSEFMTAVLDFFLGNEPTLLSFAASADIRPEDVREARFVLSPLAGNEAW